MLKETKHRIRENDKNSNDHLNSRLRKIWEQAFRDIRTNFSILLNLRTVEYLLP